MKLVLLMTVLALSACVNPMLSADMAVGTNGVSVNPTLSGTVGGATISLSPY